MEFQIVDRLKIIFYTVGFFIDILLMFFAFTAIGGRTTGWGGLIEEFGYDENSKLYWYAGILFFVTVVVSLFLYDWRKNVHSRGSIKFKENNLDVWIKKVTFSIAYSNLKINLSSSLGKPHKNRAAKEARGNWITYVQDGKKHKYEFYIFSKEDHLDLIRFLKDKPLKEFKYFEVGENV